MTTLLSVEDLRVSFGAFLAADDVDLYVEAGETVGMLGPNGAGKSTVIHSIVGLVAPQAGDILVCGAPASTAEAKAALGFAPDDLPTPLSLTGRETLALVARLRRDDFDWPLAAWLAEQFDLAPALDRPVGGYSHGMRRKLQVVCAIAHHPALLILDEPLRGLDPEASAIVHTLMEQQCARGGGVLLATHDLHSAASYCDRVTIMAQGRVVGAGRPADLCRATGTPDLESAFLTLSGLSDRVTRRTADIAARMARSAPSRKVLA